MPNYDYRCPEGHVFEVWQRMADPPGADCPECGQAATRLFFPAGIVFKGSGFYKTDSRKADGGGSSSTSSGSSSSSGGSSSSGSSSSSGGGSSSSD